MRREAIAAVVAVTIMAAACASPPREYAEVLIKDVPHVQQKPDFCGEACAEMFLRKLGRQVSQDQVFDVSGLEPALGRGCHTAELKTALTRLGFTTGEVWYSAPAGELSKELDAQFAALHADLLQGIASIVCTHYDEAPNTTEHFRLVLGYDPKTDEVVYHEPAAGDGAYRRMARERFLKLWALPLVRESVLAPPSRATLPGDPAYAIIRLRLEPGKPLPPPKTKGFTNAEYCQHIMVLKRKIPAEGGFNIVVRPPFVVVGDEPIQTVRRRAVETVKFAVDRLKRDFFKKDPAEIIDVWLFKDKESYEKNTVAIFGSGPSTPFGYYSSENHALIMNIATGGGTLIHEIVHPFMRTNSPECPPWLNEGLGSLFEQCGDRNGHLRGYTNWRLAGLQEAIKAKKVPPFEKLLAMNEEEFRGQDEATNYSQSRYLCYYLQEKGLLVKFYREFSAGRAKDATGVKTLKRVLRRKDLAAFKKEWEAYVLGLQFKG